MIYLYTGTPGSGKSLDAARMIRNQLALKHPVICNFPINEECVKNPDLFEYRDNDELTPEYLMRYAKKYFKGSRVKEGAINLVIDECQMLFNARDWSKPNRVEWNKFFQVHRHFGYDILLITQFDSMIDKQVRALVEYEVKHRCVKNFGIRGFFVRLMMLSPSLFVKVKVWYPMKEKIDSQFFRGDKKLFKLYDTFALTFLDEDENEDENT